MTSLRAALIGTWELMSREDRNGAGELVGEPLLGSDPLGLLIYDASGHFALQLMRRKRRGKSKASGYDAYFGTYVVDDKRAIVTQTLQGALSPEHVGAVITRKMSVNGETLTIQLATNNVRGETVSRVLRWRRLA